VAAVEMALKHAGAKIELGKGVGAAEAVLQEAF
jgi:aspartate aminotransferase-like enzyme